jgi:hypothetical protein
MPSRQTTSSTTARSRSNTGAAARNEIIAMLKNDHKQVKKLFRDFEKLDVHEDPQSCQAIVSEACAALELHTTLEEELFYPAARDCLSEDDLLDEAEVEHASAKELIAQLKGMTPEDDKYAATFTVLGEYVQHHIGEEENEMFPQLSKGQFDWNTLQQQMIERRSALTQQSQRQRRPRDAESGSTQAPGNRGKTKASPGRANGGKSSAARRSDQTDPELESEDESGE